MDELIRAFGLGNAAILTNACLLPLYPGLIAFLASNANNERTRRASGWLGVLVLAGVLTMMMLVGLVLYLLNQSFGDALGILLPIIYGVVIISGVLMLTGRNPFARLSTAQAPVLRNPYTTAYVYGLLFGPMTLPCTGPIILSAFALGAGNTTELVNGLLFFLAFGLGFGWPLALLPLFALPLQRRLIGWLNRNHLLLTRVSGLLLIAVGLFGILTELLPRYLPIENVTLEPSTWTVYWIGVASLVIVLGFLTYQQQKRLAG
jgi:cytochrome c-type biogenesis protein